MLSPVIVQSRRIHENILLNKDSGTTNSTTLAQQINILVRLAGLHRMNDSNPLTACADILGMLECVLGVRP